MKPPRRPRLAVLPFAMGLLLLAAAFVGLPLATPSDGARLEPGQAVWRADGVVVTPLQEQPSGLRRGDVVVAVDGRSMESWAQALFDPARRAGSCTSGWGAGPTVEYTVVRDGRPLQITVPLGRYPLRRVLAEEWGVFLFALAFQLVATFVFFKRPTDRAARALFLGASSLLSSMTWLFGLQVSDVVDGTGFWLFQITAFGSFMLAWSAGVHFTLLFPHPHAMVVRHRWIVPLLYVAPYLAIAAHAVILRLGTASTLLWIGRWSRDESLVPPIYLVLLLAAMVLGYRAAPDTASRQQVRWVVWAFVVSFSLAMVVGFVPQLIWRQPLVDWNVLSLIGLVIPLSLAIAILRYQLFDIDVVINRTLVYGTLSLLLGLLYAASVLLLHQLFRPFIGAGNDLAAVASTLAIAALFQPLRRRIQAFTDRRFYRRKYDAVRTLEAFSAKVREEVDLETLTGDLLAVVEETMQPAHVSLWLRDLPVSRHPEA